MKSSSLAAVAALGALAFGFAPDSAHAAAQASLSGTYLVTDLVVCGGAVAAQLSGTITFSPNGTGTFSYVYLTGQPPTTQSASNQPLTYTNNSTSVTITEAGVTIDYNAFFSSNGDFMTLVGSDAGGCIHSAVLNGKATT